MVVCRASDKRAAVAQLLSPPVGRFRGVVPRWSYAITGWVVADAAQGGPLLKQPACEDTGYHAPAWQTRRARQLTEPLPYQRWLLLRIIELITIYTIGVHDSVRRTRP